VLWIHLAMYVMKNDMLHKKRRVCESIIEALDDVFIKILGDIFYITLDDYTLQWVDEVRD